ncbi:LuxR C-terminal-related transcriptional regulator [Streptomyces sp. NBC_00878]|uniref:helix-turn-helix transcriptional regulator n=1 Tax=Streptomyces sp. NBC_00878 TaxID=2975854 RepID=UPI002251A045|nr:LuxR C-terminal-related transcriptional regulator [Streptomyces sp. NBC_00878]MCX4909691.1 LuxR C-terminal-related transcriptional regulator [Streptomyces sp. NBC_00878]
MMPIRESRAARPTRNPGKERPGRDLPVRRVADTATEDGRDEPASGEGGGYVLSEMDARILVGLANGDTTEKLASMLFLSRQGIEYRVRAMFREFATSNRTQLVARAYSLGVLTKHVWPPRVAPHHVG